MLYAANAPQDACGGDSGSFLLWLNAPNDHNNATDGHVYAPNGRFSVLCGTLTLPLDKFWTFHILQYQQLHGNMY